MNRVLAAWGARGVLLGALLLVGTGLLSAPPRMVAHAAVAAQDEPGPLEAELQRLALALPDLPPGFVENEERYRYGVLPNDAAILVRQFELGEGTTASTPDLDNVYSMIVRFGSVLDAEDYLRSAARTMPPESGWQPVETPPSLEAHRLFRRSRPPTSELYVLGRQGNLIFGVAIRGAPISVTVERLASYTRITEDRVARAAGISVEETPGEARLAASLLADREVPADLWYYPQLTGPLSLPGLRGYIQVFARTDVRNPATLRELPINTVAVVTNAVLVPTLTSGADSLDRFARGGQFGVGPRGNVVPLASPDIGEESRAFSYTIPIGEGGLVTARSMPDGAPGRLLAFGERADVVSGAVVIFRRGNIFPLVEVIAIGTEAPSAEALRLAQQVDDQLTAASPAP